METRLATTTPALMVGGENVKHFRTERLVQAAPLKSPEGSGRRSLADGIYPLPTRVDSVSAVRRVPCVAARQGRARECHNARSRMAAVWAIRVG